MHGDCLPVAGEIAELQAILCSSLGLSDYMATEAVKEREARLQQQLRVAESKSLAIETAEDGEARLPHDREHYSEQVLWLP